MFKFINREHALVVINQWLQDGSKLESWAVSSEAEWVVLRGRDGNREEFYIFTDEDAFEEFDEAISLE